MDLLVQLVMPIATVVISVLLAFVTARVEARNQVRRQKNLEYLVNAYRTLINSSRRQMTVEEGKAYESALADVFLFGTTAHIAAANEVLEQYQRNESPDLDPLLLALRSDLRQMLGSDPVPIAHTPVVRTNWTMPGQTP